MDSKTLTGQRVLLLLLRETSPEQVYLLADAASWSGSELRVGAIRVRPFDIETNGFAPGVLPRLVGDEKYLPTVERLAQGVAWCIPILVEEPPAEALPTPGLLGGLAMGQAGELFLMQVR